MYSKNKKFLIDKFIKMKNTHMLVYAWALLDALVGVLFVCGTEVRDDVPDVAFRLIVMFTDGFFICAVLAEFTLLLLRSFI